MCPSALAYSLTPFFLPYALFFFPLIASAVISLWMTSASYPCSGSLSQPPIPMSVAGYTVALECCRVMS